jgi:hypothetical protein
MKSKPVLIIFSTLAGLQVLTAGAALGDVVGPKLFGLFALGVAAVQVGMTFYVQNQTVPLQNVAAYESGTAAGVVAGPAAVPANGVPVDVTVADPPPGG